MTPLEVDVIAIEGDMLQDRANVECPECRGCRRVEVDIDRDEADRTGRVLVTETLDGLSNIAEDQRRPRSELCSKRLHVHRIVARLPHVGMVPVVSAKVRQPARS